MSRAARSRSAVLLVLVVLGPLGAGLRSASAASLNLVSQNLTPTETCTITATPKTTTVVIDANARQGSASTNFGATTSASVSSASGLNQRLYLRFDLTACRPTIPASAIVRLASLRLYMTAAPAACRTLDIFPVIASWGETTITWTNQPFGSTINNPASGSRTDSFNVGTPAGCENPAAGAYVTGGVVTSDVASFVSGAATNLGWMIRDDAEGSATTRTATFSTKDLGTLAQEPQLVVTYVVVP